MIPLHLHPDRLFPADPTPVVMSGLFAEVVLDRPIEQVYTYSVNPDLAASVAVGKRVRVPSETSLLTCAFGSAAQLRSRSHVASGCRIR